MKMRLNKLTLLNFKGVRSLEIVFNQITNISGENATGKTTIFDAFLWLFFGKDSTDRKDFELKTLDANNQPIHRADHEVSADITVDGQSIVIRRTYKENWKTKRGESVPEFAGHVQSFHWNDVPLNLEQFQGKVAAILPENIFKLITNTAYFNNLKWQDRRSVLLDIAGEITDQDVLEALDSKITKANQHQYAVLFNALNAKKTLEEFQREIGSKKKLIKEDLEKIPSLIAENTRNLGEEVNYDHIETMIDAYGTNLQQVEDQLMDTTNAQKERQQEITSKMNKVQEHRNRKQMIEFETKNLLKDKRIAREQAIQDAKRLLRTKGDDQLRYNSDLIKLEQKKSVIENKQISLRLVWKSVDAEKPQVADELVFKEGQFCCPTCKRDYEAADIESKKAELIRNFNTHKAETIKNFNVDKARRLSETSDNGKQLGRDLASVVEEITELKKVSDPLATELDQLKVSINTLETEHRSLFNNEELEIQRAIANNEEYINLNRSIAELEEQVNAPQKGDNKSELLIKKREITAKIAELRNELSSKGQREKTQKRIEELTGQEKELAASLADLEGIEFSILQFTKAKMDLMESRINGRFKVVKFKLFQEQINGGEVACCETLIKGVPYSDANTASKINAGLDIINTLCQHYKAYAPVFVDNAESVNTLIPVSSQLIRLVVSRDKKLKIESPKEELFEKETA